MNETDEMPLRMRIARTVHRVQWVQVSGQEPDLFKTQPGPLHFAIADAVIEEYFTKE